METALIVLHVIVCLLLIVVVILQRGKGAEMGAAFGVGSSSAVFGPKGPTPFLAKVTVVLAVIFFLNSIALTIIVGKPKYVKAVQEAIPKVSVEKKVEKKKPLPKINLPEAKPNKSVKKPNPEEPKGNGTAK